MLNVAKVNAAKAREKPYQLGDTEGLYLLVKPNGSKLWQSRYRFDLEVDGKLVRREGRNSYGAYPFVSLAEAREANRKARKVLAEGKTPVQAKREKEREQARINTDRATGIFEVVANAWCEVSGVKLRPGTLKQREREMRNDVYPAFKGIHIAEIRRSDISAHLKKVESRAPEVARNIRAYLSGIFEYAIESGLVSANPVPTTRVLKKRNAKSHLALSQSEIGHFLRAVDMPSAMETPTRVAMLLVMLTACRKAEVIEAEWSEIDLKAGEWEIPARRMKTNKPHWVPLSNQAIALLKELRSISSPKQALLFPNRDDPKRPMANRTLNAVMNRLGFGDSGTPHGMRAAFSTHFNGLQANSDVIELCLAHSPMDNTRAAYNRYKYKDERRKMLQEWADHLDGLRRTVRFGLSASSDL